MGFARLALVCFLMLVAACGGDAHSASDEQNVAVDTELEHAWAQYLANFDFAHNYQPVCTMPEDSGTEARRPRVLVTGYGRFGDIQHNATGQMVAELLDSLEYPITAPPPPGEVDAPAPQTRAARGTIELPQSGRVDVCAMVLPVFWDLAAILVLHEIAAFEPDLVLMNGVAGPSQPLWLEMGAVNAATAMSDGSENLSPVEEGTPLVPSAPAEERVRPNLLSWITVRNAAQNAIFSPLDLEGDEPVAHVLTGAALAGFPRSTNTYLCNNVTYTVGYLMDHPDETVRLMEASQVRDGHDGAIEMALSQDHRLTPRAFIHWPSLLQGELLAPGVDVLRAMIDAQLHALASGTREQPRRGDNALADLPGDAGGDTF